jgi:hypothetical protein
MYLHVIMLNLTQEELHVCIAVCVKNFASTSWYHNVIYVENKLKVSAVPVADWKYGKH